MNDETEKKLAPTLSYKLLFILGPYYISLLIIYFVETVQRMWSL